MTEPPSIAPLAVSSAVSPAVSPAVSLAMPAPCLATGPQATATAPVIEAEDEWDGDSAFEDDSVTGSTASMASSILKYREENGRTYHAYKDGKYPFPNDERENDRLDLQHHLFGLTLDGRLYTAPIPESQQLHRVLDVGCGTGIWAIDFADSHPGTEVIGVDLSPIQPTFIPPNLSFQIDDLEEPWTFSQKFDFIYSRMMTGSFADFARYFEQAFENLVPGGWLECDDICFPLYCDDGSMGSDSACRKWGDWFLEGTVSAGRPANSSLRYRSQLEAAGFINIREIVHKWPTSRWPKDKKHKEIGAWSLENHLYGLEGLSMALFTRALGWDKAEVDVFLADVRKDMKDTRVHGYWNIHFVSAQKPY